MIKKFPSKLKYFLYNLIFFKFLPITFFIIGDKSHAFTIDEFLGPAKPLYISEYQQRLFNWYQSEFGSILKVANPIEKELIELCPRQLKNWGIKPIRHSLFPSFWFAHTIKNKNEFHKKFFCQYLLDPIQNKYTIKIESLIHNLIKKRNIKFDIIRDLFWGVQFDFDNKIVEIQWILPKSKSSLEFESKRIFSKISPYLSQQFQVNFELLKRSFPIEAIESDSHYWIYHIVLDSTKLIDQGISISYIPKKENRIITSLPFQRLIQTITETRFLNLPVKYKFQLKEFNQLFISEPGQKITSQHFESFNQYSLSIGWNSINDYELFYP